MISAVSLASQPDASRITTHDSCRLDARFESPQKQPIAAASVRVA